MLAPPGRGLRGGRSLRVLVAWRRGCGGRHLHPSAARKVGRSGDHPGGGLSGLCGHAAGWTPLRGRRRRCPSARPLSAPRRPSALPDSRLDTRRGMAIWFEGTSGTGAAPGLRGFRAGLNQLSAQQCGHLSGADPRREGGHPIPAGQRLRVRARSHPLRRLRQLGRRTPGRACRDQRRCRRAGGSGDGQRGRVQRGSGSGRLVWAGGLPTNGRAAGGARLSGAEREPRAGLVRREPGPGVHAGRPALLDVRTAGEPRALRRRVGSAHAHCTRHAGLCGAERAECVFAQRAAGRRRLLRPAFAGGRRPWRSRLVEPGSARGGCGLLRQRPPTERGVPPGRQLRRPVDQRGSPGSERRDLDLRISGRGLALPARGHPVRASGRGPLSGRPHQPWKVGLARRVLRSHGQEDDSLGPCRHRSYVHPRGGGHACQLARRTRRLFRGQRPARAQDARSAQLPALRGLHPPGRPWPQHGRVRHRPGAWHSSRRFPCGLAHRGRGQHRHRDPTRGGGSDSYALPAAPRPGRQLVPAGPRPRSDPE